MHLEVLNKEQKKLAILLKQFSGEYGLVSGTAMALQIGHRRSIDFDLFTYKQLDIRRIRKIIRSDYEIENVLVESSDELSLVVDGVRLIFYQYPFKIKYKKKWRGVIRMPDVVTLAAMKAYALGRRAKWKDYVDFYYVFEKEGKEGMRRVIK